MRVVAWLTSFGVISMGCAATPHLPDQADASAPVTAIATETVNATPTAAPVPVDAAAAFDGQTDKSPTACPTDMIDVQGQYCPKPVQTCLRWLDPPGPYHDYRCAKYAEPATCDGAREAKRFCIDREEYVPKDAEDAMPIAHQSWTTASEVCTAEGKRLCLESEWQFACEGEEMRPYPYGFVRDPTACNIDRNELGRPNAGLRDLRAPVTAYPRCLSPFGVHDMSGNVEEWATLDQGAPPQRSTMKGAWWLPGKNTCRARTLGHGEVYQGPQVGIRCCKDLATSVK